ncbi:MAG: nucleoside hydrolase [Woeseia sp.]
MSAERVIIDCNPGQDDAINLLLAMAAPEALAIQGVTAVAGNVPLALIDRVDAQAFFDLLTDYLGRY